MPNPEKDEAVVTAGVLPKVKVDAVVLAGAPNVNVELGAAAEVVLGAPKAGGAEEFVVPKAGGALVVAGRCWCCSRGSV